MRHAKVRFGSSLLLACVAGVPVQAGLAEFGIEGMGVVSTAHSEVRATVSPDGRRIVWGSDRPGGPGGRDLWQAEQVDGRWQNPQPLALNGPHKDYDPMFSGDGRWLYFFSDRPGGQGAEDLYRAAVRADGYGPAENLGPGVNTAGREWAPAPSRDGRHLLFASDGRGGAGGQDLWIARWNGRAFADPQPAPGINTAADEFDATWLGDGRAIVFARSAGVDRDQDVRLYLAQCDGARYDGASLLPLSFNAAGAYTYGPVIDWNKPGELLLNGTAKAPKAGKQDIYRIKAPAATGKEGCVVGAQG